MKIEIGENTYEISSEKSEIIFEDSKKYLLDILDDLEKKENGNEDLFLYLLSLQTQLYYVIFCQMKKEGKENFLKELGAVKINETSDVHSDK